MAEMAYFSRPLALVKKYGAVVVCVNYRLSIEAPYPAALEDCHSALCWMKEHAAELEFNDSQIMVGGDFYDGWMKNKKSAMISCNDGFRPVSFLIEELDEDAE